jgi:hypothetical protein
MKEKFARGGYTLSMYKLKSNGSSAGSITVEMEDEETVLYRLLSDRNDIG